MNQPEARPVPPANPVASPGEETSPANQTPRGVPYPYPEDEIIGGDCVLSIERRLVECLKAKKPSLSLEDYRIVILAWT